MSVRASDSETFTLLLTYPMERGASSHFLASDSTVRNAGLLLCWLLASGAARAQATTKAIENLQRYLEISSTSQFRPLTQSERNRLYVKSLTNPWGFVKVGMSAAIDHADDKPVEWGQGVDGYARRVANIEGQYLVQKTTNFLIASAVHEDNRYFNSGKHGFWNRTRYAVASSMLARHDNGKRYPSMSQIGGVAAGAFAARLWLPDSRSSAGDGAISFGITMGGNAATSVVKEFLPDALRLVRRKPPGAADTK
jgi:hypothetical protein